MEFFLAFFDLIGDDLLKLVMEVKDKGKITGSMNSTFLALIPKVDHLDSFGDFRPISLCNLVYKVVAKTLAIRIKPLLLCYITNEQFCFLKNRHIHKVVGTPQEALHFIKTRGLNAFFLKIDLSKAFEKVQLLFLHIGFSYQSTKWIMSCITSIQMSLLINGATFEFISPTRGLR